MKISRLSENKWMLRIMMVLTVHYKRLVIQTLTLISLALDVFQLLNTCFFSLNFGRALVRERKRQEKYNGKESLWPVKCEGNDVEMSHGYQVGCYIEETNLFTLSLYIITQI